MSSTEDPETRIRDLEPPALDSAVSADPPRPGLRLGWIVLILLVIGLAVGGDAMLFTNADRTVAGRPAAPDIAGGGGTFTAAPTASAVPAQPAEPTPPTTGGSISVAGVDKDETHACDDSIVSVSGVHNRVVLIGHCARVDISGIRNTVIMDEADAIVISGMNNSARFHSGSPQISQSGMDNTLERG